MPGSGKEMAAIRDKLNWRLSLCATELCTEFRGKFNGIGKALIQPLLPEGQKAPKGHVPVFLDPDATEALYKFAAQVYAKDPYVQQLGKYLNVKERKIKRGSVNISDEGYVSIVALLDELLIFHIRFFEELASSFPLNVEENLESVFDDFSQKVDVFIEKCKKEFGSSLRGERAKSLGEAAVLKLTQKKKEQVKVLFTVRRFIKEKGLSDGLEWLAESDKARVCVGHFARQLLLNKPVLFRGADGVAPQISDLEKNKALLESLIFEASKLESSEEMRDLFAKTATVQKTRKYNHQMWGNPKGSRVKQVALSLANMHVAQLLAKQLCQDLQGIVSSDLDRKAHTPQVFDYLKAWGLCLGVLRSELKELTRTGYYRRWHKGSLKAFNRRGKRGKSFHFLEGEKLSSTVSLDSYQTNKTFSFDAFDKELLGVYKASHDLPQEDESHSAFRHVFASLEYQQHMIGHFQDWMMQRSKQIKKPNSEKEKKSPAMRQIAFLLSPEASKDNGAFAPIARVFKQVSGGEIAPEETSSAQSKQGGASKDPIDQVSEQNKAISLYDQPRLDKVAAIEDRITKLNEAIVCKLNEEESIHDHRYRKAQRPRYLNTLTERLNVIPSFRIAMAGDPKVIFEKSGCWSDNVLRKIEQGLTDVERELRSQHGINPALSLSASPKPAKEEELKSLVAYAKDLSSDPLQAGDNRSYPVIDDEQVMDRNLSRISCLTDRDAKRRKIAYGLRLFQAIPLNTPEARQMKADVLLDVLDEVFTHRAWGYSGSWGRGEATTGSGRAFMRHLLRDEKTMLLLAERSNQIKGSIDNLDGFAERHLPRIARSGRDLNTRLQTVNAVPEDEDRRASHGEVHRAYRWLSLLVQVRHEQKQEQDTGNQAVDRRGSFFGRHAHTWRRTELDNCYQSSVNA